MDHRMKSLEDINLLCALTFLIKFVPLLLRNESLPYFFEACDFSIWLIRSEPFWSGSFRSGDISLRL